MVNVYCRMTMVVISRRFGGVSMTTHERIRQIFLFSKATYTLLEAAELLEYSEREVLGAVDRGDLEVTREEAIPRLPWSELTIAAAERWPQELIEASLGDELSSVMPELVRLTELRVRVPRFGVVVAGRVALREGTSIDHVVSRQLLDLAVNESAENEASIAGLASAMRWPLA